MPRLGRTEGAGAEQRGSLSYPARGAWGMPTAPSPAPTPRRFGDTGTKLVSRPCAAAQRLLLLSTGGCWRQPKGRTRQDISSGWARTAGAPKSPRCCTWRRWPRAPSPSCPSGSLSKVSDCAGGFAQLPPGLAVPPPPVASLNHKVLAITGSAFSRGLSPGGFNLGCCQPAATLALPGGELGHKPTTIPLFPKPSCPQAPSFPSALWGHAEHLPASPEAHTPPPSPLPPGQVSTATSPAGRWTTTAETSGLLSFGRKTSTAS